MNNLSLLFKKNSSEKYRVKLNKSHTAICNITCEKDVFSGREINRIIRFVNAVHSQYRQQKIPIHIYLHKVIFIDKLTYVFLECICYYLIKEYGHSVQILMEVKRDIGIEGLESSPLLLLNNTQIKSIKKYPDKFEWDLYNNHIRRVIKCEEKESSNYLGKLYTEIDTFLKPFGINDDCRDKVALVITELAGNANEHANADCLIDVDVTNSYCIPNEDETVNNEHSYYGLNIAVINFSDVLLGSNIKNNILTHKDIHSEERYKQVLTAYDVHSHLYRDEYGEDDFCNVTAFQHKISGRLEIDDTGGTGLTKLIRSLQELSEAYRCYVISGNRCLNFEHNLLEYNDDGWIGFNKTNDYINCIPDDIITTSCLINMPGTAYNLNFIMRGE